MSQVPDSIKNAGLTPGQAAFADSTPAPVKPVAAKIANTSTARVGGPKVPDRRLFKPSKLR